MNEGDLGLGRPRLQTPPTSLSTSTNISANSSLDASNPSILCNINAANIQASTSRPHSLVTSSSQFSQQVGIILIIFLKNVSIYLLIFKIL